MIGHSDALHYFPCILYRILPQGLIQYQRDDTDTGILYNLLRPYFKE